MLFRMLSVFMCLLVWDVSCVCVGVDVVLLWVVVVGRLFWVRF